MSCLNWKAKPHWPTNTSGLTPRSQFWPELTMLTAHFMLWTLGSLRKKLFLRFLWCCRYPGLLLNRTFILGLGYPGLGPPQPLEKKLDCMWFLTKTPKSHLEVFLPIAHCSFGRTVSFSPWEKFPNSGQIVWHLPTWDKNPTSPRARWEWVKDCRWRPGRPGEHGTPCYESCRWVHAQWGSLGMWVLCCYYFF